MTTKQLGNIGEAKTLAKLVSMNVPVYVSFGDNEKADLVADTLLMLPIKEFEGRNAVSFRIPYVETHNQHKSLNYEDYLFDKIVNV